MKMREFFHQNLAERVVILLNCPKGRKQVTWRPSDETDEEIIGR